MVALHNTSAAVKMAANANSMQSRVLPGGVSEWRSKLQFWTNNWMSYAPMWKGEREVGYIGAIMMLEWNGVYCVENYSS